MKNKVILSIIAIGVAAITAVNAQNRDTLTTRGWFMHSHDIAGTAQFQVTYRKGNTLQLNQDLGHAGIPPVTSNDVWYNLSMNHTHEHWIMEDGLGFTPISTSTVNNLEAHYNQYQLYFRSGYNLSNSPDYRLFPFIGANFSEAILHIQDNARTQNTSDFTQELLNSTSSKTFYQPNFGIELGAGFDYCIKLAPRKTEYFTVNRSIPIGVRAGYYFNTYASNWRIENNTLNNGPTSKQSAVFVSVNIGLGYEVKK